MRTNTLFFTASLFFLPMATTACVAQDTKGAERAHFVIEAGEIKLTDLIDRAAAHLQWNILVDARDMAAQGNLPTAKLQQRLDVDRDGCEEILTSLLYRSGFVVVPVDEQKHIYEVIASNGVRAREITTRAVRRTPAEILARPTLLIPVTTTVTLKHINAMIATNSLRPFFASGGSGGSSLTIGNVGNNTGMVISGMQDQVATVLRMLETCDVPPPKMESGLEDRLEAIEKRLRALEGKGETQKQER